MPQRDETGGAVVIGGDYRALTIVRSLGRQGIPVWVLTEQQKIAAKSRYALAQLPFPSDGDDEQVAFLFGLAVRHGLDGWVLFPTEDKHAALLARHQASLARRFKLATSRWEAVETAYDKRSTYRAAEQFRIDYPLTFYPRDRKEVARVKYPFPVILKPAIKDSINRFTEAKAWRVDDRQSLLARYDEACTMLEPDLIMIQEMVPGGGEAQFSYGALCDNGRPLASVVARRTRQYPIDFGRSSSFVETIERPEVEDAARRLLSGLNYTGLMEIEFKYDSRDRRYKLLDLNPRVWGWHTLAKAGGVDFPYFFWRLVQHQPIPNIRVQPGYRWVRMTTDLPAALSEIRRGRISALSYFRSLRHPLEWAVFAADDPIPSLLEIPMLSAVRSAMRLREFRGPVPSQNSKCAERSVADHQPGSRRPDNQSLRPELPAAHSLAPKSQ
jgi:predicted ATP-grasp superfamily ATP-dependent carboligase